MTGKGKQNYIFQKGKSYEISSTVIYICEVQKSIIHAFYWCIPLDHEIYTKSINHMKAAKTQKNLKEMPYPPQKNLLKRKGNSITPAETNAPILQTSSEGLKLRNKELKMKLGQLQEEISKASLPVSADLCNNYKSIILETDQRKIYPS